MGSNQNGVGPCGACKYLRRKCANGCIFAPYFDPEEGTNHFAAVHRIFGASNASKMLMRIPAHKRSDSVLSLCYEAFSRVRDPVYGCVGHIFALQQEVVNLQVEIANAQARLSTMQRVMVLPNPPRSPTPANFRSSSGIAGNTILSQNEKSSMKLARLYNEEDHEMDDCKFHALARY